MTTPNLPDSHFCEYSLDAIFIVSSLESAARPSNVLTIWLFPWLAKIRRTSIKVGINSTEPARLRRASGYKRHGVGGVDESELVVIAGAVSRGRTVEFDEEHSAVVEGKDLMNANNRIGQSH
jgi:hypothetical protein